MTIFTGSTKVGQSILQTNSTLHKISHLELGGSAPGIILPETTIDDAMLEMIEYTRVWHSGQVCDGLKRLFVHESQYDELTTKLSDYFKSMII
jgi:acyl-CoA reductase-like NAD-dependent aldehyde dehydrogenase